MTTEIHALAGAYALDALDDIERAAFGRHLAECETCALEVTELRETTARLADVSWSVPPPRLREEVLARVSRTRQVSPGGRPGRSGHADRTRWRRWTAAAAAAGILAVGAGAATYAVQEGRVRDERTAAREQAARIEAVLSAPDVRLRAETPTQGGRVTLVISDALDTGVAVLTGMPDPGSGKSYQLWTIVDDQPKSAGVLPAGAAEGTKLVTGLRDADEFAVSLEKAGGADAPTAITTKLTLT